MPLQPFTPPLPETRFLHAGHLVYKFKIRYGSCQSTPDPDNMDSAAKELEEAIRVILGNLDDLHPFSTEHFTIFPYLSPWERVSKMRFKHENVRLVPYPYVCTMYLELNAFHPSGSAGEEGNKGREELVCCGSKVKRSREVSEDSAVDEVVKRRRGEAGAEALCPQLGMDRAGAECVHCRSKAERRSETNSSEANACELSPAPLPGNCNRGSSCEKRVPGPVHSGGPAGCPLEQSTAASQAEGAEPGLQHTGQGVTGGDGQLAGRGLSKFWRRY